MNEFVKFEASSFKKTKVDRSELLPEGVYNALIYYVGWHDNKKKTGKYLRINLSVLVDTEEKTEVKTFGHFFNLKNPSQKAVSRASEQFSTFLQALDIGDLDFNYEIGIAPYEYKRIYNRMVKVAVSIFEDQEGNIFNNVKDFIPAGVMIEKQDSVVSNKDILENYNNTPPPTAPYDSNLNDDIPF